MRPTARCAACSSCLTLLASPGSVGGGLGRDCVVSLGGVLFSFWGQNNCSDPICLFERIDAYHFGYLSCNKQGGQKLVYVPGSPRARVGRPETYIFFFLGMNLRLLTVPRAAHGHPNLNQRVLTSGQPWATRGLLTDGPGASHGQPWAAHVQSTRT